jgi:hypothetical protein
VSNQDGIAQFHRETKGHFHTQTQRHALIPAGSCPQEEMPVCSCIAEFVAHIAVGAILRRGIIERHRGQDASGCHAQDAWGRLSLARCESPRPPYLAIVKQCNHASHIGMCGRWRETYYILGVHCIRHLFVDLTTVADGSSTSGMAAGLCLLGGCDSYLPFSSYSQCLRTFECRCPSDLHPSPLKREEEQEHQHAV